MVVNHMSHEIPISLAVCSIPYAEPSLMKVALAERMNSQFWSIRSGPEISVHKSWTITFNIDEQVGPGPKLSILKSDGPGPSFSERLLVLA